MTLILSLQADSLAVSLDREGLSLLGLTEAPERITGNDAPRIVNCTHESARHCGLVLSASSGMPSWCGGK